jgi:hypothetical protein
VTISDVQLASAITGVVRVVGWSQDAVLGEIEQTPVIDQRAVDAAIDEALSDEGGDPPTASPTDTAPGPSEDKGRDRMRAVTRRAKDERLGSMAERATRAGSSDQLRSAVGAAKGLAQPLASSAVDRVRGDLYPGHAQWASLELSQRADWWAQRVGTLIGAVAAVPAITGGGAKLVKVTPLMGSAAQSVTVCAVAREGGIDDEARTVDLVSRVVFNRPLDPDDVAAAIRAYSVPKADIGVDKNEVSALRLLGAAGRAVQQVRVIRGAMQALREVDSLLGARPQAGWAVRTMTNIPIAGAAATFVSERAGIHKAADETVRLLS